MYIFIWSPPPRPHDPPQPSSHLFVHSLMPPNAFPEVRSHWYLRWCLHFTHTDLYVLCLFVVCVTHPKPKPQSGSASALIGNST